MMTGILTAIGALGTVAALVLYLAKIANRALTKTPDQANQEIDQKEADAKAAAKASGRPE